MSWMLDFDVAIEPRVREKYTPPKSLPIHITDRIPIEIIDRVIKNLLHNLVATLRCGLVCKSWLALSRHHVFRDLNMGQEDRAAAFFRLLDSPCSTVRPAWLTAISLVYTSGEPQATQGPSNWNMLSSKIRLENSFPCITSLTLRFALFRVVVDLAQMLHHLRHLEEVNLVDVVCHVSDPSRRKRLAQHKQSLRYPLPPGLRTFRVLGGLNPRTWCCAGLMAWCQRCRRSKILLLKVIFISVRTRRGFRGS
ncbi:hypothetical protein BD779DRAFT_561740 [Infundibulicybe gibba]|nr:hypothetical protein BD779DRAFT_561740 [Infundibulicybe gibba]